MFWTRVRRGLRTASRPTALRLDLEPLAGAGPGRPPTPPAPHVEQFEARLVPTFYPTTTALVGSPNPASAGQPVTLTATVLAQGLFGPFPIPPGAPVQFLLGSTSLGSGVTDLYGNASVTVTTLMVGSDQLKASFPGGTHGNSFGGIDSYGASEGSLTITINPLSPPPPPPVTPPIVPPPAPVPPPPSPPAPPANRPRLLAEGTDAGPVATARLLNPDGSLRFEVQPYGAAFTDGARVAVGDVNGDGTPDLITAPGPGGGPVVEVYSGADGHLLGSFLAFEPTFTGGVYVAAADLDRDGKAEIVVSPDQSGGPRVRVLKGVDGSVTVADFFGIDDPGFRGGVRVALGDVNGDGVPDLVVGAGFGGGPRVAVYDGAGAVAAPSAPPKLLPDFFAFEDTLRNGAYVAAGDLNGDGFADLVFGGGPGGGPRVLAWDGGRLLRSGGQDLGELANFFAFDPSLRGGVRVTVGDVNGDGWGDLVVAPGPGGGGPIVAFLGPDLDPTQPESLGSDVPGSHAGAFPATEPLPPLSEPTPGGPVPPPVAPPPPGVPTTHFQLNGRFTTKVYDRSNPILKYVGTFTYTVSVLVKDGSRDGDQITINNADIVLDGGPGGGTFQNGSGALVTSTGDIDGNLPPTGKFINQIHLHGGATADQLNITAESFSNGNYVSGS
jgi:hypothetical protein